MKEFFNPFPTLFWMRDFNEPFSASRPSNFRAQKRAKAKARRQRR